MPLSRERAAAIIRHISAGLFSTARARSARWSGSSRMETFYRLDRSNPHLIRIACAYRDESHCMRSFVNHARTHRAFCSDKILQHAPAFPLMIQSRLHIASSPAPAARPDRRKSGREDDEWSRRLPLHDSRTATHRRFPRAAQASECGQPILAAANRCEQAEVRPATPSDPV